MTRKRTFRLAALAIGLSALAGCQSTGSSAPATATFYEFQYTGKDAVFDQPLAADEYFNPVLAGFYPDPSMTRAGDSYYLTVSSFSYFPGAPIFKSDDLVNWQQIGHALDRPEQFNPTGIRMTRGMFAPTLRYHDGVFYLITTAVDAGGNFIVTATDPAGPWSDPIWLPEVGGIDPDIFFDDDGKVYITHNDAPRGEPIYDGHRAIWMWEYDPEQKAVVQGSKQLLVNGGTDIAQEPVWIEAPHIFKKDGWYYLSCAEGGTGYNHSQVIFRSRSLSEPFVSYAGNPILTQRDLDIDRANPITTAGHADMVQTQNGEWWAVFLATRAYDKTAYNTGRETFLLPVSWRDGWPHILPAGEVISYTNTKPDLPAATETIAPTSGNFTWRDSFDGEGLDMHWVMHRTPEGDWHHQNSEAGTLSLTAKADQLGELKQPAALFRRQQHTHYQASTELALPSQAGYSAGLSVFQNEKSHYYLGVTKSDDSYRLFLERAQGDSLTIIREHTLEHIDQDTLELGVEQNAGEISFYVETAPDIRITLADKIDGKMLSTEVAGGFLGAMIGMHARLEPVNGER